MNGNNQNKQNLVWIDLEMTGLDVDVDSIIQVACVITDSKLNFLESRVFDVWQPKDVLDKMCPYVRDMHSKTGLLKRLSDSSPAELWSVEGQLLKLISAWCPFGATLCGNSIWQDRKFIDKYMPGLSRYFHYRMIDVSSVKLLVERWCGDDAVFKKPTEGVHDAFVDIKNSINELKHYRNLLFEK